MEADVKKRVIEIWDPEQNSFFLDHYFSDKTIQTNFQSFKNSLEHGQTLQMEQEAMRYLSQGEEVAREEEKEVRKGCQGAPAAWGDR